MLKNLELRKDADRVSKTSEEDTPFELTQDDINHCISKEDPQQLQDSLQSMVTKLQAIKKQKEAELQAKKNEAQNVEKILKTSDNLMAIRNEAFLQK